MAINGLELLADDIDGRLFVAVVRKGVLIDLYADPANVSGSWASIYLGKVSKIDTHLDAAFIDLGNGMTGYLPAKHVHRKGADPSETRSGIADLLKGGESILVQIKSEAKRQSEHEHRKLPRLSMKLYLPGLFLAYSPHAERVTISRQIENEQMLAFTTHLKGQGGWIVQKHVEAASEIDILGEAKLLQEQWDIVKSVEESSDKKARLLKAGPNALVRALFDYGAAPFEHIYTGNKRILDLAIAWAERHAPALATSKRLRLFKPEKGAERLFDLYDIFGELEMLKDEHVPLPSGGSIVIEPTTAMIVVDVNQGTAKSIRTINQEAAAEFARQTRLRNLSGAILIDFINMDHRMERARLMETLGTAFENDPGGTQVHGFTRIGIMELTRKRRTATLSEKVKA